MPADFNGKVVLVTGAGSGIGQEAAVQFAERGALVYTADRNQNGLVETQRRISKTGSDARLARLDVASEEGVAELLTRINNETGRLDVAFNNAGVRGNANLIEDYSTEDFDHVVHVNLRSVFLGMKYQLPLMKRAGGGSIINTASVAALTGPAHECVRSIEAWRSWPHPRGRMENASYGIRINALAPAWTETPMVVANSAQNPAFAEIAKNAIPAKRGGQPREVAAAAVWLASAEASYVFGQMLVVDGGMTIGAFEP